MVALLWARTISLLSSPRRTDDNSQSLQNPLQKNNKKTKQKKKGIKQNPFFHWQGQKIEINNELNESCAPNPSSKSKQ